MIIPGKPIQNILKAYGEQSKVVKNTKTDKPGAAQQKDEVILSSEAKDFAQIFQAIKKLPDVRESKTSELAKRYEEGTYQVDSKDIADKIIAHAQADRLR